MSTASTNQDAATGGLTINATMGADAPATAAAPAGFQQAVNAAISYFETTFHPEHDVYANIDFKWAPLAGGSVAESSTFIGSDDYAAVRRHLIATDAGIAADAGLVLPRDDPFAVSVWNPAGVLRLTYSQEAVIGLPSPDSNPLNTNLDATVTLNSNDPFSFDPSHGVGPGQFDAVSTLEHEISEVFGRQCGSNGATGLIGEPFALFRYRSPGNLDTTSNIGDYFSIDGGVNSIHNNMGEPGADLADWNSRSDDCVGFGVPGRAQHFTAADVHVMEAIGWKV